MNKLSVVIRTKNQATALEFLLDNLTKRYYQDIDEIVVVDNSSTDLSAVIASSYGVRFETIQEFSYGGSANIAAAAATHQVIVIFSAHAYPVSPDFFKRIKERFDQQPNLAGLRCLHSPNDYRNYINGVTAQEDPNKSGLIFSGSAFAKAVWEKHPFKEDVATFEDKEWSKRVLEAGYDIDFVPVIFSYEIKRTHAQEFFRFKNDLIGNYQLWHQEISISSAFNGLLYTCILAAKNAGLDIFYAFKRVIAVIKFHQDKPDKF